MQHKKCIVCIVGDSGSGKTELSKYLKEKRHWEYISSYTTRPMRDGETNGVEHTFVTPDDVPDRSEMIAYTKFGGYEYWAQRDQLKDLITTYVIDEKGLIELYEKVGDEYNIFSVYITRKNKDNIDAERVSRDDDRDKISLRDYDLTIDNHFDTLEEFLKEANYLVWESLMYAEAHQKFKDPHHLVRLYSWIKEY